MVASDNPFTPGPAVMAFDPGKVTGWAKLSLGKNVFTSGEADFRLVGEILSYHSVMKDFTVGFERTNLTPHVYQMRDTGTALEVTGMIRWIARECKILDPFSRDARNLVPIPMLKAIGWYKPGLGHANDAARHLAAWLMRTDTLPKPLCDKISSYLGTMDQMNS